MKSKAGFLLIELVIALVVFCILAGVTTGYIAHACARSRQAHCLLEAVQKALEYVQEPGHTPRKEHTQYLSVHLSECTYIQKISPAWYTPLDSSVFQIMRLAIVDNNQKSVTHFSTLLARLPTQ